MTTAVQQVTRAAQRLRRASASRTPCAPVRDLIARDDVEAAYAVQLQLSRARQAAGAHIVGRKIGLTSPAVQQQLGVDQPDFGVLFDDMAVADGGEIRSSRLLQPRVEAEVAFVLGADLDDGDLTSRAACEHAVDYAVAALEIVDSRIAAAGTSPSATPSPTTPRAGCSCWAPGAAARRVRTPRRHDDHEQSTAIVVSTGTGAACLGDPLNALVWLARHGARTSATRCAPARSSSPVRSAP